MAHDIAKDTNYPEKVLVFVYSTPCIHCFVLKLKKWIITALSFICLYIKEITTFFF